MPQNHSPALRRAIRLPHATAMVAGTIIGAAIFVQPSEITGQVSSIGGVFLVWLAAGALTMVGALVCAEYASVFSRTGGVYVYLNRVYAPWMGFLWGWAMFWSVHSGIIAAIAMVFARYLAYFLPLDADGQRLAAVASIGLLTAVNYWGVRQGSLLQTLFTWGKVAVILVLVVLGFAFGSRLPGHFQSSPAESDWLSAGSFLTALIAGLFAFGGWHMVTYNAGETVQPRKTIPRSLVLGTLIVTGCYLALNAVYLYILALEEVASSTRVAADAADALFGSGGGSFLSGLVIFSTFGALSGIILAGPRVYLSMARDGLLFRWAAAIHPQYQTPHRALLLQAVWSGVLVWTGTYRELFTRVIYTEWLFFGLLAVGLGRLRQMEVQDGADSLDRFRMWGYPFLPGVFALASLAIVINQVWSSPGQSLTGLGLVVAGLPVYFLWSWWSRSGKEFGAEAQRVQEEKEERRRKENDGHAGD